MTDPTANSEPSTPSALDGQAGFIQRPRSRVLKLLGKRSSFMVTAAAMLVLYASVITVMLPLRFLLRRLPFDVPEWLDFLGTALFLWAGMQFSFLVYARLFRRAHARRFPDGRIPPTCLRCGYSLAGLPDEGGWRICPECNHKSPDRIRIKLGRMLSVFWWPQVRERTD